MPRRCVRRGRATSHAELTAGPSPSTGPAWITCRSARVRCTRRRGERSHLMASKPTAGTILVSAVETSSQAAAVFRMTPKKGTATKVFAGGDLVTPVGMAMDAKGGNVGVDADDLVGGGGVIGVYGELGNTSKVVSVDMVRKP